MNYCLPLRYATMGGYLDPEAFWRLTVVNLQDLGTSLTVNLGTSSQDVFAARGGRARPGRLDQAEEEAARGPPLREVTRPAYASRTNY